MSVIQRPPLIGITTSNSDPSASSPRYESGVSYSNAVAAAGGMPILLPQRPELAQHYAAMCDGIIFTGGGDPIMPDFGREMHPKASAVNPTRQAFELALLDALDQRPTKPALGICLGMQFMSLHAGCEFNQHLPDTLANAEIHQRDQRHPVIMQVDESCIGRISRTAQTIIVSAHRQAVRSLPDMKDAKMPVRLRIVALSPDGVIEAVDDPTRPFYAGVQWHPERGGEGPLNSELFQRFVEAARR